MADRRLSVARWFEREWVGNDLACGEVITVSHFALLLVLGKRENQVL